VNSTLTTPKLSYDDASRFSEYRINRAATSAAATTATLVVQSAVKVVVVVVVIAAVLTQVVVQYLCILLHIIYV